MLPFYVPKTSQGFTLIEQLIIILMVGILASMVAPSFQGISNRSKVNAAANQLQGALREAQRQAIRKSQDCTVTLPATNTTSPKIPPSGTTNPCLVTGTRTLNDVTIRHNLGSLTPANEITFDLRGGLAAGGTIVLSIPNGTPQQKCIVISGSMGLIRSGNYLQTDTTGTDEDDCTSQ